MPKRLRISVPRSQPSRRPLASRRSRSRTGGIEMDRTGTIVGLVLTALAMTGTATKAHDESKYPNWFGQWGRIPDSDPPRYDPSKPIRAQEAPLNDEHR